MNTRARLGAAVLGLALASTVTACATSEGRSADYGWAPTPTMADLADADWVADQIDVPHRDLVTGSKITLRFDDHSVSAHADCNTMNGAAHIDGTDLVVSALASTRMACDPALMAQDDWLQGFLTSRPRIQRQDHDLWLSKDDSVVHFTDQTG